MTKEFNRPIQQDEVLSADRLPMSNASPSRIPQNSSTQPDLVCFSHLRWDFVYQRPQHLLTRCARDRRVFFVEESVFINGSGPTKTPEYLAAGKPVISTSIRDVERPYGELNLVSIADSPAEFIRTAQDILARSNEGSDRVTRIDDYLKNLSWDKTWKQMSDLLNDVVVRQRLAQSGPAALSDIGPGVSAARAGIS